jgi:hypothetical protein
MRIAIRMSLIKSVDKRVTTLPTLAPNTFRIPISLVRCRTTNAIIPNRPKHDRKIATPANKPISDAKRLSSRITVSNGLVQKTVFKYLFGEKLFPRFFDKSQGRGRVGGGNFNSELRKGARTHFHQQRCQASVEAFGMKIIDYAHHYSAFLTASFDVLPDRPIWAVPKCRAFTASLVDDEILRYDRCRTPCRNHDQLRFSNRRF